MKALANLQGQIVGQMCLGSIKDKLVKTAAVAAIAVVGALASSGDAEAVDALNKRNCSSVGATVGSVAGVGLGESGVARTIGAALGRLGGMVAGEVLCPDDPRAQNNQRQQQGGYYGQGGQYNQQVAVRMPPQAYNEINQNIDYTVLAMKEWSKRVGTAEEADYKEVFIQSRANMNSRVIEMNNAGYDIREFIEPVNLIASVPTERVLTKSSLDNMQKEMARSSRRIAEADWKTQRKSIVLNKDTDVLRVNSSAPVNAQQMKLSDAVKDSIRNSSVAGGKKDASFMGGAGEALDGIGSKLEQWKSGAPRPISEDKPEGLGYR